MQKEETTWFSAWFNTPYYHTLYKHRDDKEAAQFMQKLTSFLALPKGASILDLACGKGRHAIFLNSLGYTVTGIDLAAESIEFANRFKNKTLDFRVHDMRLFFDEKFDAVFNLFTSFGYFETQKENLDTIRSIKNSLTPNGYAVIDFLNSNYVIQNLVPEETKTIDGITFYIKRFLDNNFICKDIRFTDNGEEYHFTERVRALQKSDFIQYFDKTNCNLLHTFGDYDLSEYDVNTSKRLILIFK